MLPTYAGIVAYAEEPIEFYVAVNGDDNNSGKENSPFATIQRAKEEVRKYNDNMSGDIVVNIKSGTYYTDTIEFTPEDSGTNGHKIIYKSVDDGKVILSAGRKIDGWKLYDEKKNIWSAPAKNLKSRQMYVNDERRTRAKAEKNQIINFTYVSSETSQIQSDRPIYFKDYKNLTDIEIIWKMSFADYHMCVQGIDGDYLLMPEEATATNRPTAAQSVVGIENAYEFLDQPGEWYLDKTDGVVYYMPMSNEDITTANVVLADKEEIICLNGNDDKRVQNLEFRGLNFEHTTWLGPNNPEFGYPNFQAGFTREFYEGYPHDDKFYPKAAFTGYYCDNIVIEGNAFKHLGGAGVWIKYGSDNLVVQGNSVEDVSQNGIMVGHVSLEYSLDNKVIRYAKIDNNYIHNIGYEFLGCVGIFIGWLYESEVNHNEIHDVPYDGISAGWGWRNQWDDPKWSYDFDNDEAYKTNPNPAWKNKIQYNKIYDAMKGADDGGAIYLLGISLFTEISGNVLSVTTSNPEPGAVGLYLDDGNRYVTVKDNIITKAPIVTYIKGSDHTFENNYVEPGKNNHWYQGTEHPNLVSSDWTENYIEVKDGNFPSEIIGNAGLEYAYQGIKNLKGSETENIALNAKVKMLNSDLKTQSSAAGSEAEKAIDENEKTTAKANSNKNWIFQLELPDLRKIKNINIAFNDKYVPKGFKVSALSDTGEWKEFMPESISENTEVDMSEIIARIIRIELTEGAMAINEIGIFANDYIKVASPEDMTNGAELVTFNDIKGHWAQEDIEFLATLKMLSGMGDGNFYPNNYMTRAEWCSAIAKICGYQKYSSQSRILCKVFTKPPK